MSPAHQDPAAASAPFDSRENGDAVLALAQDTPSDALTNGNAILALAQDTPSDAMTNGDAVHTLAQGTPSDAMTNGEAIHTLAQDRLSDAIANAAHALAQDTPSNPKTNGGAQAEPREIAIVSKRFAFEPARVEVTEGERIRLVVSSADGVHGIEIKKFRVNKKVPRGGDTVTIEFVASAAGEFPILCSEYCGNGHEDMEGMLVVAVKGSPR